jgi:UDP-glucose 4-epimerase
MVWTVPKHYLVTGGAGFIGSHLCDALVGQGHQVRVLDDLSTGLPHNLPPEAELIVGDVADRETVSTAAEGVDGVFHLAAVASVARSIEAWLDTHRTNLGGTINVFDAARLAQPHGPIPVVYASSAAIYGDNTALPLVETAMLSPLTPYGADKAGSELHAKAAWSTFGVPSTGLRFFNVYGPRQDQSSPYSGVISIFVERLISGNPLRIFGDGRQTRDFIYVNDVVAALAAAMNNSVRGTAVYNVCTGLPTSVNTLVEALERVIGKRAFVQHDPRRAGDIENSCGDPSHMVRDLGVSAQTPLDVGLAHLIDWQRQLADAA